MARPRPTPVRPEGGPGRSPPCLTEAADLPCVERERRPAQRLSARRQIGNNASGSFKWPFDPASNGRSRCALMVQIAIRFLRHPSRRSVGLPPGETSGMSWLYLWFNPCAFLSTPLHTGLRAQSAPWLPRALSSIGRDTERPKPRAAAPRADLARFLVYQRLSGQPQWVRHRPPHEKGAVSKPFQAWPGSQRNSRGNWRPGFAVWGRD